MRTEPTNLPAISIVIVVVFCAPVTHVTAQNDQQEERPNILLLTADDMNWNSVGAFGSKMPDITPNLDALAGQGMRFDRAHVVSAVCTPSRAAMLTGKYGHQNGALGFQPIRENVPTLPERLSVAGYYTAIMGKTNSTSGVVFKGPWDYVVPGGVPFDFGRDSKLFYQMTRDVISRASDEQDQPWFLMLNSHDPHRPFYGSKTESQRGWLRKHGSEPGRIYEPDEISSVPGFLPNLPDVRKEMAQYYSSVRRADDSMGQALQALKDAGQVRNTIVLFLSDHGMPMPFAKTCGYRSSTKTPLIIRWPEKIAGGTINKTDYVSTIDLLPTLLTLADVAAPSGIEGRDFSPLLFGHEQKDRDTFFYAYDQAGAYRMHRYDQFSGERAGRIPIRAVELNGRYRYIFTPWAGFGEHGGDTHRLSFSAMQRVAPDRPRIAARVGFNLLRVREELYDLDKDPHARHNLIRSPQHREVLDKMRGLLKDHMSRTNDYVLKAFKNRNDTKFLRKFYEKNRRKGLEQNRRGNRLLYTYFSKLPDDSTEDGVVKVELKGTHDLRVHIRTWEGKLLTEQSKEGVRAFEVDLTSYHPGPYRIIFYFDNRVFSHKVTWQ